MTKRNRTQEKYAIYKEETSTYIQMIVSAIEASNKELITTLRMKTRKQEILYLWKIKTQDKIYEKLQRNFKNR